MCKKVSYPYKKAAINAAKRMKNNAKILPREWLKAYWCDKCKAYHLSKMTQESWFHSLK